MRDGAKLARLDWADRVEVHRGDVTDVDATRTACRGVDAAFHLVHSMDGRDFAERDRRAAAVLSSAAGDAGVRRVVYLGGLQPNGVSSAHLASRREVGELLLAGRAPAAVLQAGIVVGRGSASFEMIRHLAESSPVLPMPDRAWNVVQPIGIDDVLHHLLAALDLPPEVNRSFDIGGPDVLTYAGLVTGYAAVAGLSRPLIVPVPVSAPNLAARAVEALTAVDRHLAGPLLESMAHDLVCRDDPPPGAPPGGPMSYSEAVRRACDGEGAAGRLPTDPRGPELVSEHVERVNAPPAAVWAVISGLGALDWWRIEGVEPGRVLRLRAELRLPGTTRLELRVEPTGDSSRYVQRVTFRPRGLPGRACWYAQLPAHRFVFAVMARTIAGVAARGGPTAAPGPA